MGKFEIFSGGENPRRLSGIERLEKAARILSPLYEGRELSGLFEKYSDGRVIAIPGVFETEILPSIDEDLNSSTLPCFFSGPSLQFSNPIDYTALDEAMAFADKVNADFEYHLAMLESWGYEIKPLEP